MEGSSTDASPAVGREPSAGFDTARYERLLRRQLDEGRRFVGYADGHDGVVLHHDVDLSLNRALTLARLEATHRIDGTYCLPLDAPVHTASTVEFDRIARTIARLGHDVGLRFDTGAHWECRPDDSAFVETVESELEVLERVLGDPVDVVSFRRPPTWVETVDMPGDVHVSNDWTGETVVDRSLRDTDPSTVELPPDGRLVVHPGLWFPVERAEHAVLEDRRRTAYAQIDGYFDPFDLS